MWGGEEPYRAPLMYQSDGAFGFSSIPSLGILKCTISGESPLQTREKSRFWLGADRQTAYVAVSCVAMQVLISSVPVFQSRLPVSLSWEGRGGMETGWVSAPDVVAPSMSEPPRKQTRWSCFGVRRQELQQGRFRRVTGVEND